MQAAPDAFVSAAHDRAVVGGQEELEAGAELEELAVEKAGGERVTRNDLLDQHLGEPATLFDLDRADEASAGETGDIVGDAVAALAGQEGGRVGLAAVVAGDGANDLQEGRFAVGTGAVEQEHGLLAGVAGERIADRALQIAGQAAVAGHDPVEEGLPGRALGLRVVVDVDQAGEQIRVAVRAQRAAAQVEGAVAAVEQPVESVEALGAGGDAGLAHGQGDHRFEATATLAGAGPGQDLRHGLVVGGGLGLGGDGQGGGLGAAHHRAGAVEIPAPAVPDHPAPLLDVAQLVAVLGHQPVGVAQIGELQGLDQRIVGFIAGFVGVVRGR